MVFRSRHITARSEGIAVLSSDRSACRARLETTESGLKLALKRVMTCEVSLICAARAQACANASLAGTAIRIRSKESRDTRAAPRLEESGRSSAGCGLLFEAGAAPHQDEDRRLRHPEAG